MQGAVVHMAGTAGPAATPTMLAVVAVGISSGALSEAPTLPETRRWRKALPRAVEAPFAREFDAIEAGSTADLLQALQANGFRERPLPDFLALLPGLNEPADAKARGAIFTPFDLAMRVTQEAHRQWRIAHGQSEPRSVLDPSCGLGVFLLAAERVFGKNVRLVGWDVDQASVDLARLIAAAFGLNASIERRDSLRERGRRSLGDLGHAHEERHDVIVGNPPYVRSASLSPAVAKTLRARFPTLGAGNFDLSVAFLEHAIDALSDGGICAYIVTSKFMTGAYGQRICRKIAESSRLILVEDYHDLQMFPGFTTYTCTVVLARLPAARRFTVRRFPAATDGGHLGPAEESSIDTAVLRTHPWTFAAGALEDILSKLRNPRHLELERVFPVVMQGMRTGANPVYIVKAGHFSPSPVVVPFVDGETIRRFRIGSPTQELVFPYAFNKFGEPRGLSPEELARIDPAILEHLESHKATLDARKRDERSHWLQYSRAQNLSLPKRRKILVREMMPRAEFAADLEGEYAFCAGYGLDCSHLDRDAILLWTGVLNTPTMEFNLRHTGTQLHSGWFRLLQHHLSRIRLPNLGASDRAKATDLARQLHAAPDEEARGAMLDELDALVARAYGLTAADRELVRRDLAQAHARSLPTVPQLKQPSGVNYEPVRLERYDRLHVDRDDLGRLVTFAPNKEDPLHAWYPYTQGFASGLVSTLLGELAVAESETVLDPFLGSGTTTTTCMQRGIRSVGIEISPLMAWVSESKGTAWNVGELRKLVAALDKRHWKVPPASSAASGPFGPFLAKAYSEKVWRQVEAFADHFRDRRWTPQQGRFGLMCLLGILEDVSQIRKHGSHYRFLLASENIGPQRLNIGVFDANAAIAPELRQKMVAVLDTLAAAEGSSPAQPHVLAGDARRIPLANASVDAVITSPPYLNRNNYLSQQKAEFSLMRIVADRSEYDTLVRATFRSHVESALPPTAKSRFPSVQKILDHIRIEDGNSRKIPHMIAGYFEDLHATLGEVQRVLRPGGRAAFVVGNSRWAGVVVPVDHLLLELAETQGLAPVRVMVTRLKGNSPQQMRKHGRIPVRESIVILAKP